ncbi:MAG: TetR/AcrR family transcriptional regulator, partial [Bryobacteraceae bacterium]
MVSTRKHAANRQRRTPVQERSQTTVARILGAASHLLAKRQLGEITTNQIARQAKLSVGALYRFFPDKQAIVDALAARHAEDLYAAALALLMQGTPTDGPAFLSAVIDAYAEF